MSDRWWEEHRRDPWRQEARKQGYRARSAFKLKQLQKRFELIRPGDRVLDVGSHPGGWTQVAVEEVQVPHRVVGIDLRASEPVDGAAFLVGDATDQAVLQEARVLMGGEPFNAVISDISPHLTGNWGRDQAISIELVATVIDAVLPHMTPGASFVSKVFQGRGIEALVDALRQRFSSARRYNPGASRKSSAEVYVVARNLLPWVPTDGERLPSVYSVILDAFAAAEHEPIERPPPPVVDGVTGGFRLVRRRGHDEEA